MIFPREKLIFVPIPKTGTVSLSTWLRQFMTPGYITPEEEAHVFGHPHHPTLEQCHAKILKNGENPNDYRSFSFIRNPWSHMYSLWAYSVKTEAYAGSFDEWLDGCRGGWETRPCRNPTICFSGFKPRLISKYRNIDYVGTFEDFDEPVNILKSFIIDKHIDSYISDFERDFPQGRVAKGLRDRLQYPKHLNVSIQNKNEYMEKYNSEQKEIVRSLYAVDIKEFGYAFDNADTNHPKNPV